MNIDADHPAQSLLSEDLGPLSRSEKWVSVIFVIAVASWISRRWVTEAMNLPPKMITDATIAIAITLLLYIVSWTKDGQKTHLITWNETAKTPWHILILFGGGFALAQAFSSTELSLWLGKQLSIATQGWPLFLLILAVVLFMTFLTEVTSNTATATVLPPVILGLATAANIPPLILMLPATNGGVLRLYVTRRNAA